MDHQTFAALTKRRTEKNLKVLNDKGEEYSRDGERLAQFKEVGMRKHETPEKALHGMAEKHNVTIAFAIQDIEAGEYDYIDQKWIDAFLGDAHNYLHLLEGLLAERLMRDRLIRDKGPNTEVRA